MRTVDFSEVKAAFAAANYLWSIPTAMAVVITMWLRALRWRNLLGPMKRIGNYSSFSSVMVGFMANNVLPIRLGEIVRALSISRKEGISRSGAFATIVVERVFDSFAILFMLGTCLVIMPFPAIVRRAGYLTFFMNLVALIVLFAFSKWPDRTARIASVIANILPSKIGAFLLRLTNRFVEGLGIFHDRLGMLRVAIFTAIIWVITAISNYCIFIAFGIYPPLIASFVLLIVVAFAVMLPSSPGFIGTFQYGCVLALSLFHISKNNSFPISIVLWSSQYFPVTILGLYYLRRESFSLTDVGAEKII